jgi:hypothetical protein
MAAGSIAPIMKRRAVLAGVPTALLFGGCTDLLTGDEERFEADTAVVAESTRSETGYQEKRVEDMVIEKNYDRVDKTVVVVNRLAEYSKEVNIAGLGGELARFTVLATPKVEVGPVGPLNPVKEMSNKAVAERLQEGYDTVDNIEQVGSREATLLGETVEVAKFQADAETQAGESVEVFIHIARVASGDDFLLAIGVHPRDIDEQDNVDAMMDGVRHPADSGGGSDGNESV